MVERLGEMRIGRRERIEKGSHCFFPQGMTSWSSSINIFFFRMHYLKKKCHGVKQNAKICALVNRM